MHLLEGTILDFRDDPRGEVLRAVFPQHGLIPDSVKIAMDPSAIDHLEDHHFALIFRNHDQVFRKFAHPDPGHTILSTVYFLNTGHHLPAEAQKVAAANLVHAGETYGTPVPMELRKIAFFGAVLNGAKGLAQRAGGAIKALGSPGQTLLNKVKENPLGTAMTGMTIYGTGSEIKNNLQNLKGPAGDLIGGANVL